MNKEKDRIEGLNFLIDLLWNHGTAHLSYTAEHVDVTNKTGNTFKVFSDDGLIFRVQNNKGVKTFNNIMEVVNCCKS